MTRNPASLLLGLLLALPACGTGGRQVAGAGPAPQPVLEPASLTFAATVGGAAPAARTVTVQGDGGGTFTWSAEASGPWLSIDPTAGEVGDAIRVTPSVAGLAAGTYVDAITVTVEGATGLPLAVPVTLVVAPIAPSGCACEALPPPAGETITVSTVAALEEAVDGANAGTGPKAIRVADGTYALTRLLHVTADDVSVRGLSGDRDAVVLRGDGMSGSVTHVFLVAGSRFTAADLTVGWVRNHAIQVQGEQDADDVLVHDVHFVDTGEQMLKVSYDAGLDVGSDRGVVERCLFEYAAGVGPQYYIGGVDCHRGRDWIVRNNVFRHIRSPEAALAEHAIHFWSDSSSTLVEGNVVIDCDRGIGFGLGDRGHGPGLIRNNLVHTTRDVGIGLESAAGVIVVHNTVHANGYPSAIEVRFAPSDATVVGNLTVGTIALRDGATATTASNVVVVDPGEVFVDPVGGDLHLRSAVPGIVDQAPFRADVPVDADCEARPQGAAPDVGADEWTGG